MCDLFFYVIIIKSEVNMEKNLLEIRNLTKYYEKIKGI